jgi:hypothetical protein
MSEGREYDISGLQQPAGCPYIATNQAAKARGDVYAKAPAGF